MHYQRQSSMNSILPLMLCKPKGSGNDVLEIPARLVIPLAITTVFPGLGLICKMSNFILHPTAAAANIKGFEMHCIHSQWHNIYFSKDEF